MMVVERMAGHDIERRWVGGERWDGGCEGGGGGEESERGWVWRWEERGGEQMARMDVEEELFKSRLGVGWG